MPAPLKSEGDFTIGDVVKLKSADTKMVVDSFVRPDARQSPYSGDVATESKIKCIWQGAQGSIMEHDFSPHHLEVVSSEKKDEPTGETRERPYSGGR